MYPIGYDATISPIFDDYKVTGFFNNLLYKFAFLVLYAAFILAFAAIIFLMYLFICEE
jgi:hypothetical protein